jgi:peptidoglycan/LPS O-acetylase OafA/YrhL
MKGFFVLYRLMPHPGQDEGGFFGRSAFFVLSTFKLTAVAAARPITAANNKRADLVSVP